MTGRTYPDQPKADAGLRHAQHTHDFALSQQELVAKRDQLQAPYLDTLAAVLMVEREVLRKALAQAGMKLMPVEARP